MSQDDVERVKEMIFAAYLDMDASDLAKRMNAGMSAREALRLSLNGIIPEVISSYRHAALSAMPQRLSPDLIAQLNKLATYLTEQGEYEAVDLIDTVVARVTAMPPRLSPEMITSPPAEISYVGYAYARVNNQQASSQPATAGGATLPGGVEESRDHSRELLAEALEALTPFAAQSRASGPTEERNIRRARAAADKIRAAMTQEKQT